MKPREFDELIRQKFDQNDFEYNPMNWERLADELDGKSKRQQRAVAWWWMPLAGVAASIALAMGVMTLWHSNNGTELASNNAGVKSTTGQIANTRAFANNNNTNNTNGQPAAADQQPIAGTHYSHRSAKAAKRHQKSKGNAYNTDDWFAIDYKNAVPESGGSADRKDFNFMGAYHAAANKAAANDKEKKKDLAANEAVQTFKPEAEIKKAPTFSVILSGGVNRGSQNNGYSAGATIRKMVNDKVYVESDIAFASSANTITQGYLAGTEIVTPATAARTGQSAGRTTTPESSKNPVPPITRDIVGQQTINYTLNYLQVTPSIGCKVVKRVSIGAGPDFEKALADNRPATSTVDRDQLKVAPLFDVGMIGKTEYTITQNIKAAVSYRKGINNILTVTGKYIDRDYLQFQVKCAIFNK
jgi:hypothetical protein